MASPKLFQSSKGSEHSTERAELRGKGLFIAEELTEGRSIDITALKQIQDVTTITARYVHKDNFTFQASHSLLTTTNYIPVVNETDHGTWRRLALLIFPYTFRKPGEPLHSDSDRVGDPTLKARIRHGADGQHDAIVTWAVDGAIHWYTDPNTALTPTTKVKADTRTWRADADRILGFWEEQLIADRDACIPTTDMLEAFNSWLRGNGHNEWSKERFGPRFIQHAETVRHGVATAKPRHLHGLSRHGDWPKQQPARPAVYQGVRFQTASDAEKTKVVRLVRPLRKLSLIRVTQRVSQRVRPLGPTGNPRPQATAHAAPNCSTPSNSNAAPADPAWSRRCSHDHRRISRRGWAESEALTRALINLAARGLRTHCSDATLSELWLSDHPGERREATRLCQGCPVFAPCGAAADERDERHGVWGGVDRTVTPGRAKSKT
jgi:Transcription factor WhiB/Poxvirus D5 protein-like